MNLPVPYNPNSSNKAGKTVPDARKAKSRHGPSFCRVILFNTERLPPPDCAFILSEVFGMKAEEARLSSWFQRHISLGPFSREVAETKMRQVREAAQGHNLVAPAMRREFI